MKTWIKYLLEMGEAGMGGMISPQQLQAMYDDPNTDPQTKQHLDIILQNIRAVQARSQGQQRQAPQAKPQPQAQNQAPHIDQTPTIPPGKLRWA